MIKAHLIDIGKVTPVGFLSTHEKINKTIKLIGKAHPVEEVEAKVRKLLRKQEIELARGTDPLTFDVIVDGAKSDGRVIFEVGAVH